MRRLAEFHLELHSFRTSACHKTQLVLVSVCYRPSFQAAIYSRSLAVFPQRGEGRAGAALTSSSWRTRSWWAGEHRLQRAASR